MREQLSSCCGPHCQPWYDKVLSGVACTAFGHRPIKFSTLKGHFRPVRLLRSKKELFYL